ncbi:MAG TPA: glycosyltransferase family 39 protein [Solirubrobacteraceae bacterium]|nr:glycosyltransferase family 39 protein [Solirubrobacteraceae bacterium]
MPALRVAAERASDPAPRARAGAPSWWPLAALVVLAAALRLPTLAQQSFWYDEAFSAVHVFHSSLSATLKAMVHTENSPPLWYLLGWVDVRVLGDGAFALRLPSALAGIATVPVVWAIGRELAGRSPIGRRAAAIVAAIVAVNPLFVWYSQEARVYSLFVFTISLATLCFVRALAGESVAGRSRIGPRGRMAAFAASGSLALLTHYFSVFLLAPMALWLLRDRARRRAGAGAVAVLALVGLALVPLIVAQGGHGTQWIGRWALSSRLEAIPQYYLTGASGAPLGHGIELLIALPILAGVALGAYALRGDAAARARQGALLALALAAGGVLAPLALALAGADYLAPRNLVGAMIPVTVVIAVLFGAASATHARARAGAPPEARLALSDSALIAVALTCVTVVAFAAVCIDVSLSPRLQRGNWSGVARGLGPVGAQTAISTVELASAPLEYYVGGLHKLRRGGAVTVSEIDEIGYAPLRNGAGEPPARGFRLVARTDVDGLITYRFRAPAPVLVSERALARAAPTQARPEVLVARGARTLPSRET